MRMFVKAGTSAKEFESPISGVHEYESIGYDRRDKVPL